MLSTPFFGNSNIATYFCSLNATSYAFANEISRMSGIDIDYILGVFHGTVQPPFLDPLDCIANELVSYYSFTRNVTETVVPQWEALVRKSPINESTPCSTVLQIESLYFQQDLQTASLGTNAGINRASIFVNIGRTSMYLGYMNDLKICSTKTLVERIAEILNIDPSIVSGFLADQSNSVPHPLSCISGLVDSISNVINSTYSLINITVAHPSPSSNCEPFYSQFAAFEVLWFKYVKDFLHYAINQSVAHPELTSFFTANLLCEIDALILFASNATSLLSGVDSDVIFNILQGSVIAPFGAPLDCITNKLLFMSNQISTLVDIIVPGLQSFAANSASETSTCNMTYQALTPYVERLVTLLNKKGLIMTNATIDFKSINLDELFLETFASVLDCLPNLIGKYVGAALNDNGTSVTAYASGNRFTLPYPFNCVKIIIDIFDSIFNQALVNFVTDSAANVVVAPNVPKYRG